MRLTESGKTSSVAKGGPSRARPDQSSVVPYQMMLDCLSMYTLNICSYLQINHLFLHEKALTVAQKHKKFVEIALNKSLCLWLSIENRLKIVSTMLIRGCGHF